MKRQLQDKKENSSINRFWNQYLDEQQKKGIKENVLRWYVIRVEQYIKAYSDKRLANHTAKDVETYFGKISRENKLKSWQFYQLVQAIQILFVDVIRSNWKDEFNWDYWLASSKELENNHPTVARDNSKLNWQYKKGRDGPRPEVRERYDSMLRKVIAEIRRRHYSIRTEKTYVDWIVRYGGFHISKNPVEMGVTEVIPFLEYLAVGRNVSASTQNQALNALVFLYNQILQKPLEELGEFTRAKRPQKLPVVLSVPEVKRLLEAIEDNTFGLMAGLLYGSGLRLMECIRLRVQDVDFDYRLLVVRNGKGLNRPFT